MPISSARLPLWEIRPIGPCGRSFETSSSSAPASNTPRQLGPSSTTPASRARAASARSRAPPASPSASPAVITTSARTPAPIASSTAASSAAGGTASTASAGGAGSSPSERYAGRPITSPPRRLTRYTARRSLASQRPAREPVAPLDRIVGRADDRDRRRARTGPRGRASLHPAPAGARRCPRRRRRRRPTIVVPVTYAPPAEARNAITAATSSGRPSRPSGTLRCPARDRRLGRSRRAPRSRIVPGATQTLRIP